MVATTPTTFAGDWVILLASGVTQTLVVDAATDVHEFEGRLPEARRWVKPRAPCVQRTAPCWPPACAPTSSRMGRWSSASTR